MDYELFKNGFIKLKKKELDYIDTIVKISSSKILLESEKLEIYRKLKKYEIKINEALKKICNEVVQNRQFTRENLKDIIIEFPIDKNYLCSLKTCNQQYIKKILVDLGIDIQTYKFKLTLYNLIHNKGYQGIDSDLIQNNQKLIENPIYIFCGYYDLSEDCYGPCCGESDDYKYGLYENIHSKYSNRKEILKKLITTFEKDKIIIYSKEYVDSSEIKEIFEKKLLNIQNKTLNECITETINLIDKLNYIRSPEHKEKELLDKINELYKKVKGKLLKKEVLYSSNFLNILRETYKLPNKNIVEKEKIIKNGGKDSVIVIAITQDKEYIITFQNRIKDKIIAEFPSGYIENNEDIIKASKRELKEEIGFISDHLFVIDKVYTSPGIDNSVTYIVIANNCIKTNEKKVNSTELLSYGFFSKTELKYLIDNNVMSGSMNKLAYYNLINYFDNNYTYEESNNKVYRI